MQGVVSMENVIVIAILVIAIGAAIAYLVKAKRSGVKCIGCPSGGSCSHKKEGASGCGCGGKESGCDCEKNIKQE